MIHFSAQGTPTPNLKKVLSDFYLIVALDAKGGMGLNGKLAWHSATDLKLFKSITTSPLPPNKLCTQLETVLKTAKGNRPAHQNNCVIMGRKTWESLPPQFRPLPKRLNMVISGQPAYNVPSGVSTAHSLNEALRQATNYGCPSVFCIGGAQLYADALLHPRLQGLFITRLPYVYECDVFFPTLPARFTRQARVFPQASDIKGLFLEYWGLKTNSP